MSRNKKIFKNIVSFFDLIYLYICTKINKNFRHIYISLKILLIIPLFLIISCNSTPKSEKIVIPEPEWIENKKGVFPDSEYLAQLGTGYSENEAVNNSIAQLASYFNTNVKSLVQGDSFILNDSNNNNYVERTIKSSVITSTDLELFALETTQAYYLEREGKWYCCAYINRADAWNQYEPLVRDQKNTFYSIFNLAAKENDPLEKIKIYNKAQIASEQFLGCLYRATMFSKPKTDAAFAEDRAIIASIPGLIQKQKNNCVMCVNVQNDFGNIISSAVNHIFSEMGFSMSNDQNQSYYIVDSIISYNEIVQDDLIVYYPSIKINVKSKDRSVYVYENKLNQIMSYNEAKAKKSACDQISSDLENKLAADFKTTIGLSE